MVKGDDELLRVVTRAYSQMQREQACCCGITSTQCHILCAIGEEGNIPQGELIVRLGLEKSWVSRALDTLESDGLVARTKCCEDARMYNISFTDAGRKKYEALNEALRDQAVAVMELIPTKERSVVRRSLHLLANAVSSAMSCCKSNIRSAADSDIKAISELLVSRKLVTIGIANHISNFIVMDDCGSLVACAGFETYEKNALVRSVAVSPIFCGKGLGTQIVKALETRMLAVGIEKSYLLTVDAVDFWKRLGYNPLDRNKAPKAIQTTDEFRTACPGSAVLMVKKLGDTL
jgi:N-acetylglutamate synthase-like GNAT family acetyltransferase/DNA-binding MarR family transcriptional regulator